MIGVLGDAWVHDLDPVIVEISGPLAVRWYGMAYLGGFVAGLVLLKWLARRGAFRVASSSVLDALFVLIVGVVVGGRVGYALFYNPALFGFSGDAPFWRLLALNEGGMASHGGMIGVCVAGVLIARRHGVPWLHVMDALAVAAPIGLFFGRVANFVNGELLGEIVVRAGGKAPWWSVRFPGEMVERTEEWSGALTEEQWSGLAVLLGPMQRELEDRAGGPIAPETLFSAAASRVRGGDAEFTAALGQYLHARHPSQLYQALAEGVVVFVVLMAVWWKPRRAGVIGAWFLMVYGAGRVVTEFYRLPDVGVAGAFGLSRGQLLSCGMVLAGAAVLVLTRALATPVMGGWVRTARGDETPTGGGSGAASGGGGDGGSASGAAGAEA